MIDLNKLKELAATRPLCTIESESLLKLIHIIEHQRKALLNISVSSGQMHPLEPSRYISEMISQNALRTIKEMLGE